MELTSQTCETGNGPTACQLDDDDNAAAAADDDVDDYVGGCGR